MRDRLQTRHERLLQATAERKPELSDEQTRLLERLTPEFRDFRCWPVADITALTTGVRFPRETRLRWASLTGPFQARSGRKKPCVASDQHLSDRVGLCPSTASDVRMLFTELNCRDEQRGHMKRCPTCDGIWPKGAQTECSEIDFAQGARSETRE